MTAPIALTLGDPAGIGPEISLAAWQQLRHELPFFLIADLDKMQARFPDAKFRRYPDFSKDALTIYHLPFAANFTPGQPDAANASPTIEAIKKGVALVKAGDAAALCTNPINKNQLARGGGFTFPGHTEFLAHLTDAPRPIMLLQGGGLRVVPLTIHIALQDIPAQLTRHLLHETLLILHREMQDKFALPNPRIAVAGLNPHAGEEGRMGDEEIEIITPLLEQLRQENKMQLIGPLPADTMFHPAARQQYDVALCMYHDQALIPVKTLAFDSGVNITLGLPIIRTSPDHGTAYAIAGQNKASPTSLIEALRTADALAKRRPS